MTRAVGTGGLPGRVVVRAPGKVNLALHVSPVGDDGYHRVVSVFQAVSLFEDVTATPADGLSLTVSGAQSELVPLDASNIAWRAAELLAAEVGMEPDVHLHLAKGVPVAGGMAGGSADGAATLLACDALWGTALPRERLLELAGELGADVAFPLVGHTAVGTGRGELLTPALVRGELHWAFGLRHAGISTAASYGRFDARLEEAAARRESVPTAESWDDEPGAALMAALRAGDAVGVGAHLRNDLEAASCDLEPALLEVLDVVRAAGALGAVVSGSGPTVAALGRSPRHALALAAAMTAEGVVDDVVTATGNVPGARLLSLPAS